MRENDKRNISQTGNKVKDAVQIIEYKREVPFERVVDM